MRRSHLFTGDTITHPYNSIVSTQISRIWTRVDHARVSDWIALFQLRFSVFGHVLIIDASNECQSFGVDIFVSYLCSGIITAVRLLKGRLFFCFSLTRRLQTPGWPPKKKSLVLSVSADHTQISKNWPEKKDTKHEMDVKN